MTLLSRLLGLVMITIGALLGYGICLFVLNIYLLSSWLSVYLDAPEVLSIILTILAIISLLSIFIFAIIIAIYLVVVGLSIMFKKDWQL